MKAFNSTYKLLHFKNKFNFCEFIDIGSPKFKKGKLTICPTPIGNL